MSEGIPYADIIILALVAGFILLRLRSVLGAKSEDDPDSFRKETRPVAPAHDRVVQLDAKAAKQKPREELDPFLATVADEQKVAALNEMKEGDPQFTVTAFVEGARRAFEMIFDAFAKGDKSTLKMLLSETLYDTFCKEIDARDTDDSKTETTLLSVKTKAISLATLEKSVAKIGVQFESEQVTVVRDSKGEIVGGSASEVHHVDDEWVFERDMTSKNPNWKLIET